jgi:enoyl-CoA hydratase
MKDSPVIFEKDGRMARIILNRPEVFNAIDDRLPKLLQDAVEKANADESVRVIVLSGAGKAFCAGYDLKSYAEDSGNNPGFQSMPWDPVKDYAFMKRNTGYFMSLWRSLLPVICKIQGYAIAGGTDIAFCADLLMISEDAKLGYPPARVWGCPPGGMWVYRLGAERAKRLLLTGDLIDGKKAAEWGLGECVPESMLDQEVEKLAQRMASIPRNQLVMQKMMVNQALENMGLASTQTLAALFDGIARHTPEGVNFKNRAEEIGWKEAVKERDQGSFDWTEKCPFK